MIARTPDGSACDEGHTLAKRASQRGRGRAVKRGLRGAAGVHRGREVVVLGLFRGQPRVRSSCRRLTVSGACHLVHLHDTRPSMARPVARPHIRRWTSRLEEAKAKACAGVVWYGFVTDPRLLLQSKPPTVMARAVEAQMGGGRRHQLPGPVAVVRDCSGVGGKPRRRQPGRWTDGVCRFIVSACCKIRLDRGCVQRQGSPRAPGTAAGRRWILDRVFRAWAANSTTARLARAREASVRPGAVDNR